MIATNGTYRGHLRSTTLLLDFTTGSRAYVLLETGTACRALVFISSLLDGTGVSHHLSFFRVPCHVFNVVYVSWLSILDCPFGFLL